VSLILQLSFDDVPGPPPPAPENMDSVAAASYMVTHFASSWTATPWRRDNEQSALGEGSVAFASVLILPGDRRQSTLGRAGNRLFARHDVFSVTLATPKDQGVEVALNLGHLVLGIFEGYRNGGLYTTLHPMRRLGNDGRWFRVVVDVLFHYHEMK
jgi:hypothetical protein